MEAYVGKKQFMAFIASVALGLLLFGFQNFTGAQDEVGKKIDNEITTSSCPYSLPEDSVRSFK